MRHIVWWPYIAGATILMSDHVAKSLKLIWQWAVLIEKAKFFTHIYHNNNLPQSGINTQHLSQRIPLLFLYSSIKIFNVLSISSQFCFMLFISWWLQESHQHSLLTHWGWATHICVGNLTTIGSDNGLSPGRRKAIIWTNAGLSLIGPLGTNFREILIGIQTFSFKKMHLKMSSAKWRPFASASMC